MDRLIRRAPAWDRFARWPSAAAWAVLAGFVLLLALAAWTAPVPPDPAGESAVPDRATPASHDTDLRLYGRVARRVDSGDSYYRAAVDEHRAGGFPVRPGFAVRLPTLAYLTAWLGHAGLLAAGALLAVVVTLAWWRRLGHEPGGAGRRVFALLLLAIGAAMGLKPTYLALHEVWAGMLLALSFGLHRPGRWAGAWLAAAMALAIREHALPFVLLMAAMAAWRRDWRETTAWAALVVLFAIGLGLHLAAVAEQVAPGDPSSPPWLVLRGLRGWTANLIDSSSLHLLPRWLGAPLALLPLIGWAGWRSAAGLFGTLLHAGYGVLFMLAGRDNNFYWALVVAPTWFMGLAFAPRALASLLRAALGKT